MYNFIRHNWVNKTTLHFLQTAGGGGGAQWLGGRVLDLRPRSCGSKLALCPRARRIDLCSGEHRMTRPDIADF